MTTIDTKRADLETAVLLLVGKACERALTKGKNRSKPEVPSLVMCIGHVHDESDEVLQAYYNDEGTERIIDELGDVIACAGLALWRAHGGGGE